MNRRDFIHLALAASAGALLPAHSLPSAPKITAPQAQRPKRGLGYAARKDRPWRERLQSVHASWFYSWSSNVPGDIPPDIEFVPMIFRTMSDEQIAKAAEGFRQHKSKYVLGFNEPDAASQGNITVEDALDFWPKLMALNLPLGSPACVHPDKEWMTAFMQGVKERKLRLDFITVHSYGGPDADGLMKRLESVYRRYNRPLWITEFGVGDWKAKTRAENRHSPEVVLKFMKELLPQLDRCRFVDRYAWFPANQSSAPLGSCALFNESDGTLTPLGEAYCSL